MLPEKTVNGITFKIRHTMLPVSDLDRTLDFYTRLLGMDVQRRRDTPAVALVYFGFGPGRGVAATLREYLKGPFAKQRCKEPMLYVGVKALISRPLAAIV